MVNLEKISKGYIVNEKILDMPTNKVDSMPSIKLRYFKIKK